MSLSAKQFGIYAAFLIVGGLTGWASGVLLTSERLPSQGTPDSTALSLPTPANPPLPIPALNDRSSANFIAQAVERVGPAVVRIDAARTVAKQAPGFQAPIQRFFEEEEFPEERVEGTGSGFILTTDGHIVTNAHVVEGADSVMVSLKDGREFSGEVIGVDPVTDIAAIRIEAIDLPTVTLGNSQNLIPGQWAIAIGNPLGLDNTVTAGIISATGRSSFQVGIPDRRVQFIQTDAAINPGNSGGPLLNDQGEVIGINTAIRANAQGLGFAIPIETAQRVVEQLFATGQVQHPYLGIQMTELTPIIRQRLNEQGNLGITITADTGVLILDVVSNSPAAEAGLQTGDVVNKVAGVEVRTAADVQAQVEASTIGEPLPVEINRGGTVQVIEVQPRALPVE
ncbi:MAG: PDZ domain-containing protein [Leptolyngbyaceae cyanobacterium SL_7_1]|nr:PDZ domain-containing protein [Leptolyngbyaceae cyanobacterium SL_7_1]